MWAVTSLGLAIVVSGGEPPQEGFIDLIGSELTIEMGDLTPLAAPPAQPLQSYSPSKR